MSVICGIELSLIAIVNGNNPEIKGVPYISPVEGFKYIPTGNIPDVIFQFIGCFVLFVFNVSLYATDFAPVGKTLFKIICSFGTSITSP